MTCCMEFNCTGFPWFRNQIEQISFPSRRHQERLWSPYPTGGQEVCQI